MMDRPVKFAGTDEQRLANYYSHDWMTFQYSEDDAETECAKCCAKPWHTTANYRCGASIPRETVDQTAPGFVPNTFAEIG